MTGSGYLFPLLTYPYVSRVLGVDNIGVCNFVDSIINYYIIFAQLGILSYGCREIARCQGNKNRIDEVFSNLFVINSILVVASTIVLIASIYYFPGLIQYKQYLWIGVFKIIFTLFLIEWLYQGLEQFKYITIRSVIVKLIYVVCVFIFVHTPCDTIIYYALASITIVVNAAINWKYSKKFVKLRLKKLKPLAYIMPILIFGYYRLLTSMYTTYNTVYLGFTSGETEVGYFTTATKLHTIILSMFTALTTVMIPRISYLWKMGEKTEIQDLGTKVLTTLLTLTIPIVIFSCCYAHDIVLIIAGPGYSGADVPFQIVIFLLVIIGMEQVIIQQFIMASPNVKYTLIVSTIGAMVGLCSNFFFIPKYASVGASISWGISEISVLLTGVYILKHFMNINMNYRRIFHPLLFSVMYVIPIIFINNLFLDSIVRMLLALFFMSLLFVLINFKIRKDEILYSFMLSVLGKIKMLSK